MGYPRVTQVMAEEMYRNKGCILLSEFKGSRSHEKLKYQCLSCKNEYESEYSSFQKWGGCKSCSVSKKISGDKDYFQLISNLCEVNNWEVITEKKRVSCKENVKVRINNVECKVQWYRLSRGHIPKPAAVELRKLGVSAARQEFTDRGHIPLFTVYVDNKTNLPYICGNCEQEREISIVNLRKNKYGCDECGRASKKVAMGDISNYLQEHGATLIPEETKYNNNMDCEIVYNCSCGNKVTRGWKWLLENVECDDCTLTQLARISMTNDGDVCRFTSNGFENRMIEKHGVKHAMHSQELFSKYMASCMKKKDYTFPSGKVIQIMGDEGYCLDTLLKTYTEDEIIAGNELKMKIPYIHGVDNEGRPVSHVYYPDIFVPKKNLVIEVKSTLTYGKETMGKGQCLREQNHAKWRACVDNGYNFIAYIYKNRGKIHSTVEIKNGVIFEFIEE